MVAVGEEGEECGLGGEGEVFEGVRWGEGGEDVWEVEVPLNVGGGGITAVVDEAGDRYLAVSVRWTIEDLMI